MINKYPLNLQLFADDDDNELLNEDDFEDVDDDENQDDDDEVKKQSRKKNAEEARKRREQEQKKREEEIRKKAFEEGKKAGKRETLKTNEFTDEPIENELDVEMYEVMKEIDARGGNPTKEFAKEWAKRENSKRSAQEKEEADKKKRDEREKADQEEFKQKVGGREKAYSIMKDPDFQLFAKKRIGVDKLVDIYEDFTTFKNKYSQNDGKPKVPSGVGGDPANGKKNVDKMSEEEFTAYFNAKYHQ